MLPRASLRNPIAVLMISLAVIVLGVTSYKRLAVDLFPQVSVPVIVIGTVYPGATPEVVEQTVSFPLERAVAQTANVWYIESVSRHGFSSVTVWFRWGANVNQAQLETAEMVKTVIESLPPGVWQPVVMRFDVSRLPLATIAMEGSVQDERTLYDLAFNTISPQLSGIPGIANTRQVGGLVREVVVEVDPNLMRERGVSIRDVEAAVRRNHLVAPAGNLRMGAFDYQVFTNSLIHRVGDFDDIIVRQAGEVPVRVRDVGKVKDAAQLRLESALVNGKRAVYMDVFKVPGANTIEATTALRAALPNIKGLPAEVKLSLSFDQATYVENAIDSLQHELLLGGLLALVIILLFLGSLRSTLIVATSLPLSIAAAFIALYAFGHTLNIFTLGGLALSVGILVDDAIVVLENIHRHIEMGRDKLDAALDGTREVALPVLSATITTCIIFMPLTFLSGVAKYLFTPLAFTASAAIAASYLVSMTVVPAVARAVLHGHDEGRGGVFFRFGERMRRFFQRLDGWYERRLVGALRHRGLVTLVILGLFGASLLLVPALGTEFFPETDEDQFTVRVRAPVGTRVEDTEKIVSKMERVIESIVPKAHRENILSNVGVGAGLWQSLVPINTGPHAAVIRVELVARKHRDRSSQDYENLVRERLVREFPGIRVAIKPGGVVADVLTFGTLAPIDVEIRGFDMKELRAVHSEVVAMLEKIQGIKDVFVNREFDYPQFNVEVDRLQAGVSGVTMAEIGGVMRSSLFGDYLRPPIYFDKDSGNPYYIITRLAPEFRQAKEDLGEIFVMKKGKPILLKGIANVQRGSGPPQIDRRGQERVIDVLANPVGRDLGSLAKEIEQGLRKIQLPAGVTMKLRGQTEEQRESFKGLFFASLLALALVYMVLATQYKSLLHPFLTMFTVPLGFTGVFLVLYLTGTTISTTSFMGMIMMVGIVVRNGVLLISYANDLRADGMGVREATIKASRARLRPILMTAIATILGLLPMAMGVGTGTEANVPLARAVVGGLAVSTFLTLFLVPALYSLVEEKLHIRRALSAREKELLYK